MGKKAGSTIVPKKENLHWTHKMDKEFLEAMLHEQLQGNRVDGHLTTTAYSNMLEQLREKLQLPDLKKEHLKNRIKTLKENFAECYEFFRGGLSGFSWSSSTKMWSAEPEVWKDLIEAKPAAQKWMTKQIHNYDLLHQLFAKDRATGDGAETAKEKRKRWEKEKETNIEDLDYLISQKEGILENIVDVDEVEESIARSVESHSGTTSKVKKQKKRSLSHSVIDDDAVKNLFSKMVDVITTSNDKLINAMTSFRPRVYSPEEIYAKLQEMGLEEPEIQNAYFWLMENEKSSRTLFGLPLELRAKALERLMNDSRSDI